MRCARTFTALALLACFAAPAPALAIDAGKLAGDEKNADRDPVKAAQKALRERGYDVTDPDGKLGPKTNAAIRAFQKAENLPVTGRLDTQTMDRLKAGKHESRPSASPR